MDWLPNTIDAISRLYIAAGTGGVIALGTILALLALVGVLYRHTGQIVKVAADYVEVSKITNKTIIGKLDSIATSNADIMKSNKAIMERVGGVDSLTPICKFPPDPSPSPGPCSDPRPSPA